MKTILKTYLAVIGVSLACFEALPEAQAVVPPPDGGYSNFTTAEGTNTLKNLTSGAGNTGVGWSSLLNVTTGSFNTATGAGTLVLNTGNENTATGAAALLSNTIGEFNTAAGAFALMSNQESNRNNAVGDRALFSHTSGDYNNAVGTLALASDTAGEANNAFGDEALNSNTTGSYNVAIGDNALHSNTIGVFNTAIGRNALYGNMTGSDIIAVGANAGEAVTMVDHVICIGHPGANLNNSCFIGNIYGALIDPGTAVNVGIDASGRLGTTTSSRRFKRDIKPMNKASEAIHSLKPVTFHYQNDSKDTPCFGLIAEEVAAVNPDLVVRNKEGNPYTVRYDQVNAMLLNEFLKEHRRVENQESRIREQEMTIAQQQKTFEGRLAEQQKQIDALTAGLQKVSAQLEMSRSERKTALND